MNINALGINEGSAIFYTESFRRVLDSHMDYLRNHELTTILDLEPDVVYRYEFDFYGLLAKYGVPDYMHWIVLRMNRFISPQEFPSDISQIHVPSAEVVEQIRQIFTTTRRL